MGDVLEEEDESRARRGERKKDKASRRARMSDAVFAVAGELGTDGDDWLRPLNRGSGLRWIGSM